MSEILLSVKKLSKKYSTNSNYAVKNINFDVKEKSIVGILGANGAGKSTILKALTGVHTYNEGSIIIDDLEFNSNSIAVKKLIGYVSDNHLTFEKMTGIEYVNFVANVFKVDINKRTELLTQLDSVFELGDSINQAIESYSHGMKQKIAIIASLIHSPKLWILDEPTNGLDPQITENLLSFMKEYRDLGNTILFSSHHLESVAHICDKVILLSSGSIVKEITMKNNKNGLKELKNFFKHKDTQTNKDIEFTFSLNKKETEEIEEKVVEGEKEVVQENNLSDNVTLNNTNDSDMNYPIVELHDSSTKFSIYKIDDTYCFFKYLILKGNEILVKTIENINLDSRIIDSLPSLSYKEIKDLFNELSVIITSNHIVVNDKNKEDNSIKPDKKETVVETKEKEELNSVPLEDKVHLDKVDSNVFLDETEIWKEGVEEIEITNRNTDNEIEVDNNDTPIKTQIEEVEDNETISPKIDSFVSLIRELNKRGISSGELEADDNLQMELLCEVRGGRFSKFKVYCADNTIWIYKYRISNSVEYLTETIEDISLDEPLINKIESKNYTEIKAIFDTLIEKGIKVVKQDDSAIEVTVPTKIEENVEEKSTNEMELVHQVRGGRFGRFKVFKHDNSYFIFKYIISTEGQEHLTLSIDNVSVDNILVKNIKTMNYFELKDLFYKLVELSNKSGTKVDE